MNDLQAVIDRIRSQPRSRLAPPPVPPRCTRCHDTHMLEMIGGTYTTPNGLQITATEDAPVYRPCDCRHRRTPTHTQPREF